MITKTQDILMTTIVILSLITFPWFTYKFYQNTEIYSFLGVILTLRIIYSTVWQDFKRGYRDRTNRKIKK